MEYYSLNATILLGSQHAMLRPHAPGGTTLQHWEAPHQWKGMQPVVITNINPKTGNIVVILRVVVLLFFVGKKGWKKRKKG